MKRFFSKQIKDLDSGIIHADDYTLIIYLLVNSTLPITMNNNTTCMIYQNPPPFDKKVYLIFFRIKEAKFMTEKIKIENFFFLLIFFNLFNVKPLQVEFQQDKQKLLNSNKIIFPCALP